nr:hypothetical protein [Tanacetum cinerariifolium]
LENSEDEGDGEEDQGLNICEEERHVEEEEENELYKDVIINQGRGIQANLEVEDSHVTLTPVNPDGMESIFETTSQLDVQTPTSSDRLRDEAQRDNDEFLKTVDENMKKIIKEQVKEQVNVQVSIILPRIKQAVNEQLKAEVLTQSSHSSRTSYAVAADLSEMELKKILIEKMEGNKSTQGFRSRQVSASEFVLAEEPMQTTSQMEEPSHPEFNTDCAGYPRKHSTMDKRTHEVDTLTTELLAGPTYELLKGSCKSLIELEYHLEEVFKATTDQLDWVNPEG